MNQNQHSEVAISKQSEQVCDLYRRRLIASIDCTRFLLKPGLSFRGHDESTNSINQGNFLELLKFLVDHNETINDIVLENAPENHQLVSPIIQKDIVNAAALETTNAIISDVGDELFAILVDETHYISNKEQMVVTLCYVNKKRRIVEGFLGMVHVKATSALSLKMAIDELFCKHGLSVSRIRAQGYDDASNMQGEILEFIKEDRSNTDKRAKANGLLCLLGDFDFAFILHLMKDVFGILNELSQAYQKNDQDIMNAMNLVNITKERLQTMRESGWESLLQEVTLFCNMYAIDIPKMEDIFLPKGRSRRGGKAQGVMIEHYYCVELFYTVVDMQLQELNDSFTQTNTQLLLCMAYLNPANEFSTFDKRKLIEFAKFYPHEFSSTNLMMLDNQLEIFIIDMRSSGDFASLKGISNLLEKLVETKRHNVYPFVYCLLKLAMI